MNEIEIPKWSASLEKTWRKAWGKKRQLALKELKAKYEANPGLFEEELEDANMIPYDILVRYYETPMEELPTAKSVWEAFNEAADALKEQIGPGEKDRIIYLALNPAAWFALEVSGVEISRQEIKGLGRVVITGVEAFEPDLLIISDQGNTAAVSVRALPEKVKKARVKEAYVALRRQGIASSAAFDSAVEISAKREGKTLGM